MLYLKSITNKVFPRIVIIGAIISIANGCATVPTARVWQPWSRVLTGAESIPLKAVISVAVTGETLALIGDQTPIADSIKAYVTGGLVRRGFTISDENDNYKITIRYKTERNDKMALSSTTGLYGSYAAITGLGGASGGQLGHGVSIAKAVSLLASQMAAVSTQTATQIIGYTHVIALEIRNSAKQDIWQGESAWDSRNVDILSDMVPAIQILLSSLPADITHRPKLPEVKPSHALNYYNAICDGAWFACPALPYKIGFGSRGPGTVLGLPPKVKDPNALAAIVDLLQTAEFALPLGDSKYNDPLRSKLWIKAGLGGQYLLGPQEMPVNIRVEMTGRSDGYVIDRCWIASDEEYADFRAHLSDWKKALDEFFNVFK